MRNVAAHISLEKPRPGPPASRLCLGERFGAENPVGAASALDLAARQRPGTLRGAKTPSGPLLPRIWLPDHVRERFGAQKPRRGRFCLGFVRGGPRSLRPPKNAVQNPCLGAWRPPLCHSSSQAHETSTQSHTRQSLTKPGVAQFSGLADARPEGFTFFLPEGFAGPRRGGDSPAETLRSPGSLAAPRPPAAAPAEARRFLRRQSKAGGFFFWPPGFKFPGKSPGPRSLRGSKARRFQPPL